ncbi:PREDICTED: jmjC domain-containing histone demethylation protein 1 isoform X2 [Papilio polytes]|uniref:jmjC domain-containing histone demethylation protein 1 isoform X2 n=1 Tax=Papilio polytes TaxID=76194 RepID=UPI000676AF30|nr:PREDICTED: jmjC domain-containing histone demethylation protein 1 isoform X2 [Papilio polytes]
MSETLPNNKKQVPRQLRERKQRKLYSDEWALGDDEAEGGRGFSLADKLESPRFEHTGAVIEMTGSELTISYLQKNGFTTPLLFKEKNGLGLRVPTSNFTVNDVRMCVGSRRLLDVMDVNTQKNIEMTMKDWQRYYDDANKERLLNVISLEFSHTRLENYVQAPRIVRLIDWVDTVWPRHLKDLQTESTNALDDMMYPKVQKYCLMSVKGCYTDFHIDFGGTSVWYHILRGAKVFWLIPPTEKNLQLYEKWVLSGKQSDVFFGDTVEKCIRVHLQAGHTFFIPTGWIHAVYTPSDSLVFGGNFLHQFGIEKQLKIAQVEDVTKVPQKFRYPFFTEMLWYVLDRYVIALLGRTHLALEGAAALAHAPPLAPPTDHVHLTQNELHGLKAIVMYLHQLPAARKSVPELLSDPIALVRDVRTLVEQHRHDKQHLAVTGVPLLKGPEETTTERRQSSGRGGRGGHRGTPARPRPDHANSAPRRRRTRCKKCEACLRTDCGECVFCHDMVKFGGQGRAKQTCVMRQCLQPMLPVTASCAVCHLDGWMQTPVAPQAKGNSGRNGPSVLRECSVCYSIVHPGCVPPGGQLNEDLPNSWECPTCTNMGLNHDYKPRHFRARQKSSDLRRISVGSDVSQLGHHNSLQNKLQLPPPAPRPVKSEAGSDSEGKHDPLHLKSEDDIKREECGEGVAEEGWEPSAKKRRSSHEDEAPKKQALRAHLALQLTHHSGKNLKRPLYPVRPAGYCGAQHAGVPWLDRDAMIAVFSKLTPIDLTNCSLVCKAWAEYTMEPSLWRHMSFVQVRVSAAQLAGIVRRQPHTLGLEWCQLARRQLAWLLARLPTLRTLSLAGSPAEAALALRSPSCPPLTSLDLSFARCLDDAKLRGVLAPPEASRPGGGARTGAEPSRLAALAVLRLPGTDITDVAMRYVVQALPKLCELDASSCARLTDAGAAQLAHHALQRLSLAGCRLLTEAALDHLARCPNLVRLDLRHVPLVSTQAVIKFAANSKHNLHVQDVKLVELRKT